jgi:hydroxymethylglutaryl-CoA lyase
LEETRTAVKIIECPRDAMQGIKEFIPTEKKIEYITQLLKVGFDTIDFGSFVSAKAVPQMQDTAEVLAGLPLDDSSPSLLAIVANTRGVEDALKFTEISYLGFPLSLSETFQQKNTNKSINDAFEVVREASALTSGSGKKLVVYLSMGFGNPYGDLYTPDFVLSFVEKLDKYNIPVISLSDTVGVAENETISNLFSSLIPAYPHIEFGAHLHSSPFTAVEKIRSAYTAGCRRFDTAVKGYGGCPMAKDDLVGNIATETLNRYFSHKNIPTNLDITELEKAIALSTTVFPS